jgi:IclR family transcriptional regulator, acetate operon repressor
MLGKAMNVLRLFSPLRRDLGVIEAAELLGTSKSTVSRWLSAMEQAGFLAREGSNGRYRLSMELAALGDLARQSTSLQRLARPALEQLTAATGETSDLVVLEGNEAVNVDMVESPQPVKLVGWLGRRLPLHATASGKVLLAWRDPAEVQALLRLPLQRFTNATVTSTDALLRELAEVRELGYAAACGELEEDLVGIAAPVQDRHGKIVGVISIGAPLSRVPGDSIPALAKQVGDAARSVSGQLGYVEGGRNVTSPLRGAAPRERGRPLPR